MIAKLVQSVNEKSLSRCWKNNRRALSNRSLSIRYKADVVARRGRRVRPATSQPPTNPFARDGVAPLLRHSEESESPVTAGDPVVAEGSKARKALAILDAIRRCLAGDDVIGMADGEAFNIDVPRPGIVETLDPIWCEHKIEIERAVAELDEVLAQLDLMALRLGEGKAEIAERGDDGPAVVR